MTVRRSLRSLLFLLALAAPVAWVSAAHAQASDPGAAAEDLFQRGKEAMIARRFDAACPLLLESYRLDPAGGTLQNLAICYEKLGLWASAFARFHELETLSEQARPPRLDRIKLANEHLANLEPKLSRIRIVASEAGVTVKIDGIVYAAPSFDAGIVVDPGNHELEASAPKKLPHVERFTVTSEASVQTRNLPALEPEPQRENALELAPSRRSAGEEDPMKRKRLLGATIGSAGVIALGAGLVFGLNAISKNEEGKADCIGTTGLPNFDPAQNGRCIAGQQAWAIANQKKDDARTDAAISTVLVPIGLVAIGVGAYFLFFARRPAPSRPTAGVRLEPLGPFAVQGSF